jgi:GH25 family lysozyme M1 (1,4-beta-N-acetylmuramidase)
MAVKLCREYAVTYPIFIEQHSSFGEDGKQSRADGLDVATRTSLAAAFCETVENSGYRTVIMATPTWLLDEVKMSALNKYYTYLAEYREKPTYEGSYVFRRYTDEAWVNGVNGRCNAVIGYYE